MVSAFELSRIRALIRAKRTKKVKRGHSEAVSRAAGASPRRFQAVKHHREA